MNFATAGCDAAGTFFYDNPTEYYYDDDGLLVAVDDSLDAAGLICDPFGDDDDGNRLAEEDVDVEIDPISVSLPLSKQKEDKMEPVTLVKPVETAAQMTPVVSGRRKKKRKRRNRRPNSIQSQRVRSALLSIPQRSSLSFSFSLSLSCSLARLLSCSLAYVRL